jgi:hypothetical protein
MKFDWQGTLLDQAVHISASQYQGVQRCYTKILAKLEDSMDHHCLIKCLGQLHTTHKSKQAFRRGLNKLDKQSKDIMINAKKNTLKSSLVGSRFFGFAALEFITLFFANVDSLEIEAT